MRVFDAADGRERAALFTGARQVSGLAFSPDGRRLYAAGWGMGGVKVFDPARDPRGRRVPGWPEQIAALTFDREGLRILGIDWTVRRADLRRPGRWHATDRSGPPRDGFPPLAPRGLRLQSATAVGWRRRRVGTRTVVGVWDVALGRPVAALRGSGGPVTAVAFGPDGRSLATAAAGGPNGRPIVTLWHLASGRADPDLRGGAGPGRGPRLQRRRPQARGGRRHDRAPRAGSPPGTRRRGPCWGPWTAWAWSSPWRSTRTGSGSPSRITGRRRSTSGTSPRAR